MKQNRIEFNLIGEIAVAAPNKTSSPVEDRRRRDHHHRQKSPSLVNDRHQRRRGV